MYIAVLLYEDKICENWRHQEHSDCSWGGGALSVATHGPVDVTEHEREFSNRCVGKHITPVPVPLEGPQNEVQCMRPRVIFRKVLGFTVFV